LGIIVNKTLQSAFPTFNQGERWFEDIDVIFDCAGDAGRGEYCAENFDHWHQIDVATSLAPML